jgi:hypothetical protein
MPSSLSQPYCGAKSVIGIEPDESRVLAGRGMLEHAGLGERATLMHVADTRSLPFENGYFGLVLVNAVREHIALAREASSTRRTRQAHWRGHRALNRKNVPSVPVPVKEREWLWRFVSTVRGAGQ